MMKWSTPRRTMVSSSAVVLFAGVALFGLGACELQPLNPPLGSICSNAAECESGHCVDGVCCETLCNQTCMSCNGDGQCVPTPAFQEHRDCPSPHSVCDGNGRCALAAGEICTDPTTCASGQCVNGVCCDGSCVETPTGTPCAVHTNCASGFCIDGFCCDTNCFQTCMACNNPGNEGICSPVPKFAEDPVGSPGCKAPASCDGEGTCRANIGDECGNTSDCWTGVCSDGVCCESACDGVCMTCNGDGKCVPKPEFEDDDKCPGPHRWCNGKAQCVWAAGEACSTGTTCASGFCADGVCCDSACTDTCRACNLPGSTGICIAVPTYQSDSSAMTPCNGPDATCNGSGECKYALNVACNMSAQCMSGWCVNGTCQTAPSLLGPLQWQSSNDQTVCQDPNGNGFYKNQYPTVNVRQIVARDDGSIYGVGDYTLPSQGLTSYYGDSQWAPPDYHINDTVREGPHAFQLDFAVGGASATWSTVANFQMSECFTNQCHTICLGLTCLGGTAGVGPFIVPAGGDVVYFFETLGVERWASAETTYTCDTGEFVKRAAPQWSLGTTDVCAHEPFAFAGDAAGNVVTREDDRLKKYDPSGAVVLDVLQPFGFAASTLGLAATGDIHGAAQSSAKVSLGRTNSAGTLAWTKTFPNVVPPKVSTPIDLAVDALGNSIVAFYAHQTMDLGNGSIPRIGVKDLMLAKFDLSGNLLWAKRMGSGDFTPIDFEMRKTGADEIALLVHFAGFVDLGDGLLQSSPVLVKYDGSGNLVWRADLLSLYPQPGPEVLSVAISGHPSGAVFVAGTGYGLASSMPTPNCDLGAGNLPGTYPRPLRLFEAKYGP